MRKKTKTTKNPIKDHIADFADMDMDEGEDTDIIKTQKAKKRDKEFEDETDRMWMYKENFRPESDDSSDEEENDLWGDEQEQKVKEKQSKSEDALSKHAQNIDKYMSAAAWFHDMSKQGAPSQEELRYVDLMIIELSKFYFDNLNNIKPSKKCEKALKNIKKQLNCEGTICIES